MSRCLGWNLVKSKYRDYVAVSPRFWLCWISKTGFHQLRERYDPVKLKARAEAEHQFHLNSVAYDMLKTESNPQ